MIVARRADFFESSCARAIETSGASSSAHFDVYGFIPDVLQLHPLFGLGLNNFSVYYEFVTGRTNWGPHSFYVALLVETGLVGTALFGLFLFWIFRRLRAARRLGSRARGGGRPARRARAPAGLGPDRRARRDDGGERLLPDDAVLLLLRVRGPRAGGAARVRRDARMKVVVLTTSYPRSAEDVAGRFVADAVERVEAAGVEVEVVSPARFRHFGIAYGGGIVNNLRSEPWRAALLPVFMAAYGRAARRRRATPTSCTRTGCRPGLAALATRKPYVLQLWGTDVELARRLPGARPAGRRAGAGS